MRSFFSAYNISNVTIKIFEKYKKLSKIKNSFAKKVSFNRDSAINYGAMKRAMLST